MTKDPKRDDFMALVAPKAKIKRRHLLQADLYRLRQVVGTSLKAGTTSNGDFILYTTDASTWQKLVKILPFLTDFREQRIDPVRTKIELLEVVDKDDHLFT
ncbi:hypothetical protein K2P47_01635 [Patescibacteria group bacterium]|nr:hypothetical protein [Patescibacteria group bacterium]